MIKIICVGKIKENYLNELIDDYLKRISKYHKIEIIEVKDNDNLKIETDNLLKVINPKDYNIALCLDGKTFDSVSLAHHIINICKEQISFSDLTFPHGLFRGILLEQIYRSFKINNNECYHK